MRRLFIAMLAIASLAALPAAASASVSLRDKNGEDPGSIVLTSSNLMTRTAAAALACSEMEIRATRRGEGRYTSRTSRWQGGVEAESDQCPVLGTGGRVTFRVRPIRFRSDIDFSENSEGKIEVATDIDFELLFLDQIIGGPFRECKYSMPIRGRMNGSTITLNQAQNGMGNVVATIQEGGDRFANGCAAESIYHGDFSVTDRSGEPVIAM